MDISISCSQTEIGPSLAKKPSWTTGVVHSSRNIRTEQRRDMPINQKHGTDVGRGLHFAFHADETGDYVNEVKIEMLNEDGDKVFKRRLQGGSPKPLVTAWQITEDGENHLFSATTDGIDEVYEETEGVDPDKELEDAGTDWPGKAYAQELSEDKGVVLYCSRSLSQQSYSDREFDFVMTYVFVDGEEATWYTAEPW